MGVTAVEEISTRDYFGNMKNNNDIIYNFAYNTLPNIICILIYIMVGKIIFLLKFSVFSIYL